MYMDFSGLLFVFAVLTTLLVGVDTLFFKKMRGDAKPIWVIGLAYELFPVFLLVFCIRTFVIEPYRIPSGSMKPTLVEGDFVLVNKFKYGWHIPYIDKRVSFGVKPERGDVIVFRYPPKPTENFIKRVIGLPGDEIIYQDKQLFINGQLIAKAFVESDYTDPIDGQPYFVREYREDLMGVEHDIYERPINGITFSGKVPEGHYFVMGDNRDDSGDSRLWGFVPDALLKGDAFRIMISIDMKQLDIRWKRTGEAIE